MGDKLVGYVTLIGLGFLLGLSVNDVQARRETDEQKWERLQKQREFRRNIERKYEACMYSCRENCDAQR
jgi:hypothetical protein